MLTLLASATAAVSVSHRRAAQRLAERVTLTTAADSAIRIAVLRLIAPQAGRPVTSTSPSAIDTPNGAIEVTVQRERARIDLNAADQPLILALLIMSGLEDAKARAMAARIADWIDADDEAREGGAESAAYTAAGRPYGPRNGPFESVEELRQLLGAEEISADVFGALTVYSHERVPSVTTNGLLARALRYANERFPGESF